MKRQIALKLTGKDVVSIDIGQHTTKIVAGKPGGSNLTVQHAISVPTPKDSYEKGRITDIASLKKTIGGTLDSLKIRSRLALCTVESSEIITREVLIPTAGEAQIEKMLEFEIQQYMPIELDEYIVQSKILEALVEEGVEKTRVLVTAVPRELAKNYYELLHAMGLQPAVMDIQSNAVDKLLGMKVLVNGESTLTEESVAFLDIGYNHINVIVMENGKYKFNRFVNLGARNIDHNLANFMDVTFEEAEKLKLSITDLNRDIEFDEARMNHDDDTATQMRVLNIVRNTVDSWVDDIERIFKYYTTRGAGNSIDAIYLYGGSSQMRGLDSYLQDAFNIRTSSVSSMTNVTINHYSGEASLASFINALGTMIRR